MNVDSAFSIGVTHRICEDYARSGGNFSIITDGCSASADADVGARLLAFAASDFLDKFPKLDNSFYDRVIASAIIYAKSMALPEESLDSTLIVAHHIDENEVHVSICGDGVIVARERHTGKLRVFHREFEDEFPLFLSYSIDPERYLKYIEAGHGSSTINRFVINTDGEKEDVEGLEADVSFSGSFIFQVEEYDFVAIMSDGVTSFYKLVNTETSKNTVSVGLADVLYSLLSFKNFNGSFVQRRLNRFLKDMNKMSWHNADDISLGVIYTG